LSYLTYMLPEQIKKAVDEQWPVVIPAGCIELHGNHLPVGTDLIIVEEIIKKVEPHVRIVVIPSIAFGPTGYAVGDPKSGTVDVRVSVFKDYVKDILLAFYRMGFREFVVILQHQGPDGPEGVSFKMAAAEIFNEFKELYGEAWFTKNYSNEKSNEVFLNLKVMGATVNEYPWPGSHGAWGETEPMLALRPEYVAMDKLKPGDFPWNWCEGNEAIKSEKEHGDKLMNEIVKDWIEFFKLYLH